MIHYTIQLEDVAVRVFHISDFGNMGLELAYHSQPVTGKDWYMNLQDNRTGRHENVWLDCEEFSAILALTVDGYVLTDEFTKKLYAIAEKALVCVPTEMRPIP